MHMRIGCIYLLIINLLAALVTARDKHAAKRGWRRVPESSLLWLAALGGSIGELTAMYLVRHKTRKPKFRFGVPAILLVQVALLLLVHYFV